MLFPVSPVDDAARVDVQICKVSHDPLLQLQQVQRLAVDAQLSHAAQEAAEGVGSLAAAGRRGAACPEREGGS